ncbi:hypothetical protein IAT40_006623 [Kwoniella sp. CBS 6097]
MSGLTTPSATPSGSRSSYPSTHIATPVSLPPDPDSDQTESQGDNEAICTKEHPLYCFDVLVDHFHQHDQSKSKIFGRRRHKSSDGVKESESVVSPPFRNKDEKYALFVTWNTNTSHRANHKPSLRGCIGNFSPMPLEEGLREYALISAFDDHRFSPIKPSELPSLSCNVSLLTPFTPIPDPLAWTPGVHGIHITFTHPSNGRSLSATYLPEICPDQGWTREETVLSAIAKAGYKGRVDLHDEDDPVWSSLRVKVYESQKATADWAEYLCWKESRGGTGDPEDNDDGGHQTAVDGVGVMKS